jgi:hypothetical protein
MCYSFIKKSLYYFFDKYYNFVELSLVAYRLSLVAYRLSLIACRLSLIACRLSLIQGLHRKRVFPD